MESSDEVVEATEESRDLAMVVDFDLRGPLNENQEKNNDSHGTALSPQDDILVNPGRTRLLRNSKLKLVLNGVAVRGGVFLWLEKEDSR